MKFKGDIIITDPCYLIKEQLSFPSRENFLNDEDYDVAIRKYIDSDDWERCNYGDNMEVLGFTNYLVETTMHGDWSCITYSSYGDILGRFCADAGLVGVFLLDEILKYNPEYKDHLVENPFTTTLIKDFDGDIDIMYSEEDDEVSVIGTSTKLSFYTKPE